METITSGRKNVRSTEITMPCRLGFHARIATQFFFFVRQFRSRIHIVKGELVVDGKSILGLLVLGASWNSKLHIEVCGEDAEKAVQDIETYFQMPENCLDEDE